MVKAGDGYPLDSVSTAISEISASWQLQLSTALAIVSIAFFNFFGVRDCLLRPAGSLPTDTPAEHALGAHLKLSTLSNRETLAEGRC